MQSIKNTVVAVGLLGLSFVFYQLTSSDQSTPDESAALTSAQPLQALPPLQPLEALSEEAVSRDLEGGAPNQPAISGPPDKGLQPPALGRAEAPPASFPPPGVLNPEGIEEETNSPLAESPPPLRDQKLIEMLPLGTNPPGFVDNPFVKTEPNQPPSTAPEGDMVRNAIPRGFDNSAVQKSGALEPVPRLPKVTFVQSFTEADRLVKAGQFDTALQLLSQFYDQPERTPVQDQRLMAWLNGLATKVIFSTEHHLTGAPYLVTGDDTLEGLAKEWMVPAELIFNVNRDRIGTDGSLTAGTELKKIQGPFHATVDREQERLTLFLNDRYAGEYSFKEGISGPMGPGQYKVVFKSIDGYYWKDAQGIDYPPESPQNGYGRYFIGLENHLCIHAMAQPREADHHGCLGFPPQQAADLFAILSTDSVVTIR